MYIRIYPKEITGNIHSDRKMIFRVPKMLKNWKQPK